MKNIMIVDDDIYIGNMIEETMLKNGYGVSRAYSGTEAMLLLKSAKPDLILLDLMLPGISGEEVLSRIKDVPVIVVSAKADIDDKVGCSRAERLIISPSRLIAESFLQESRFSFASLFRVAQFCLIRVLFWIPQPIAFRLKISKFGLRKPNTQY